MPIISTPKGFNEQELYLDLESTFGHSVFLASEDFDSIMRNVDGFEYIDLLSNACSLKYAHNDFHLIAAGRHHGIPAGHDARRVASGDARRVGTRAGRAPNGADRSGGNPAVCIHAAAILDYPGVTVSHTTAEVRNSSALRCL